MAKAFRFRFREDRSLEDLAKETPNYPEDRLAFLFLDSIRKSSLNYRYGFKGPSEFWVVLQTFPAFIDLAREN